MRTALLLSLLLLATMPSAPAAESIAPLAPSMPESLIAFAREHNLEVYLHPLFGGAEYTPKWVNEGGHSVEALLQIMRERIPRSSPATAAAFTMLRALAAP